MKFEEHKKTCSLCGGTGVVYDGEKVGKDLRARREAKNLSLREVARRMGYSAAFICDLEKGHRNWTAGKIADYLKVL